MQKKYLIQDFSGGIDNKVEATILDKKFLQQIENYNLDEIYGVLTKRLGSDFFLNINNVKKIKGFHFFRKIDSQEKYNDLYDFYNSDEYLIVVIKDLNDNDNILISYKLSDNPLQFSEFINKTPSWLLNSNDDVLYEFKSIGNICFINNKTNNLFYFRGLLNNEDKTAIYSFISMPAPENDLSYQFIRELDSNCYDLDDGIYNYFYTFTNDSDESNRNQNILEVNTLFTNNKVNQYSQDALFYYQFITPPQDDANAPNPYPKIPLLYYFCFLNKGGARISREILIIDKINKRQDWANLYTNHDKYVGVVFKIRYVVDNKTFEVTLPLLNIKKDEINKAQRKIFTFRTWEPYLKSYLEGTIDLEILFKTSEIDTNNEHFELECIKLTNYNTTTKRIFVKYDNLLKGADIIKKTLHRGEYENTYNASNYLCEDDEMKGLCLRITSGQYEGSKYRIETNNFYSLEILDAFPEILPSDIEFVCYADRLKITIPNNTLLSMYNINKVNVYRSVSPDTKIYYLENTFDYSGNSINYESNQADNDLLNNPIFNVNYIHLPICKKIELYNNQLFVITEDNLIRYSDEVDLTNFRLENYITFSIQDGGLIENIKVFNDNLLVFLQNKLFVIYMQKQDEQKWRIENRTLGINYKLFSKNSIAETQYGIIFLTDEGFYITDTFNVKPLFALNKCVKYIKRINKDYLFLIQSFVYENKYYMTLPLDNVDYCNYVFIIDLSTSAFYVYKDYDIYYISNQRINDKNIYYASNKNIDNSIWLKKFISNNHFDFYDKGTTDNAIYINKIISNLKKYETNSLKNKYIMFLEDDNNVHSIYKIKDNYETDMPIDKSETILNRSFEDWEKLFSSIGGIPHYYYRPLNWYITHGDKYDNNFLYACNKISGISNTAMQLVGQAGKKTFFTTYYTSASQVINLLPNTKYKISGYFRGNNTNGSNTLNLINSFNLPLTTEWIYQEFIITTNDNTSYTLELKTESSNINPILEVDELRLDLLLNYAIELEEDWQGTNLGNPIYPINKQYVIITPIEANIILGRYNFDIVDYEKSMRYLEIFFKNLSSENIIIEYSINGGAYNLLTEKEILGSYPKHIGYYTSDIEKIDYFDRYKFVFNQTKRFDTIDFKIIHIGLNEFQIKKILYYFLIHPIKRNRI